MALTLSVEEIVEQSKSPLLGIAPGWKRMRLGDIATIQNGAPFKSELFNKEGKGMPVIRIRDVGTDGTDTYYSGEYDPAYVVRAGDLLIGMDGDFNCARWKGPDALLNQRVCRILPKTDKYEPRLMDHALPGYLKAINEVTSSVTVKHLSSKTVADIPLPLPPPPQQRRIVEAIELQLGRLDAAVARLQGAKARLKRYKQAVLKAAVEGSYCETPLEEWTENVLGDIATTIRNGYSKKPNAEEGIRIFRISAVRPLELFVDDVRYLEAGTKDHEASMVTPGDVLFTRYNGSRDMVGACALVPNDCPPTVHPDKLIRVRMPSDELLPGMLAILGTVGEGRAYIESKIRTTAGQSGISGGDLKSLPLRYPPVEDQKRIIQEVEVRLNGMQELETTLDAQLQQAVRLRQAVLKRAFEGKLV